MTDPPRDGDIVLRFEQRWLADVAGHRVGDADRQALLGHADDVCKGTVRSFTAKKGWGELDSADAPFAVWFHFSVIDGTGYRTLAAGDRVEFRWRPAFQDGWRCSATWVCRSAAPEERSAQFG